MKYYELNKMINQDTFKKIHEKEIQFRVDLINNTTSKTRGCIHLATRSFFDIVWMVGEHIVFHRTFMLRSENIHVEEN